MKNSMNTYWHRIKIRGRLVCHWIDMLLGRSYWHARQGLGRQFLPGQLMGYYNDLTEKVHWRGPIDNKGLPLNRGGQGELIHFPTTLLQKALGHWDKWLENRNTEVADQNSFENLAKWALETQDENGGWPIWPLVGLNHMSPYSAMTQGEGISVLVRAYSIALDERYLRGARRALWPLLMAVEKGGTCRRVPEGLIFEEVPCNPPKTILNGWIFALYGLYDYILLARSMNEDACDMEMALQNSLGALIALLPQFNARFWSYYDLLGNLASPFYHQLHMAQLQALELTFPEHATDFAHWRHVFESQAALRLNYTKAFVLKAYQKLHCPPEVVLR